ncbi:aldose 1-epimerase family protein [Solicola sp. PLA-1-18]|uniref:aldose 1-epimerase family protein n=1 Tax=Solicola sp. PLA-1-18 TaxID=3380532 RepID=UPI003B7AF3E8
MSTYLEIAAGPHRAAVDPRGGALVRLLKGDRALVVDREGPSEMRFRGDVLVPWPNRVADGRWSFAGREHQLALNEPERHNALHGLVLDTVWDVAEQDASSVRLTCEVPPQDGYPFRLATSIAYALGDDGLTVTLETTNTGDVPAPYGAGFHPYLVPGGVADDVELDLGASRYVEVTPDRLLPVDEHDVGGTPYDFRTPRRLGGVELDTAFTELDVRDDGNHAAHVGDLRLWWEPVYGWLQVFTSPDRTCFAVEPQTCGPDALRSGADLVVLQPGGSHRGSWGLGVS